MTSFQRIVPSVCSKCLSMIQVNEKDIKLAGAKCWVKKMMALQIPLQTIVQTLIFYCYITFATRYFADPLCAGIYSCAALNKAGVTTREMAIIIDSKTNLFILLSHSLSICEI